VVVVDVEFVVLVVTGVLVDESVEVAVEFVVEVVAATVVIGVGVVFAPEAAAMFEGEPNEFAACAEKACPGVNGLYTIKRNAPVTPIANNATMEITESFCILLRNLLLDYGGGFDGRLVPFLRHCRVHFVSFFFPSV
jgi:hypothetical protein